MNNVFIFHLSKIKLFHEKLYDFLSVNVYKILNRYIVITIIVKFFVCMQLLLAFCYFLIFWFLLFLLPFGEIKMYTDKTM